MFGEYETRQAVDLLESEFPAIASEDSQRLFVSKRAKYFNSTRTTGASSRIGECNATGTTKVEKPTRWSRAHLKFIRKLEKEGILTDEISQKFKAWFGLLPGADRIKHRLACLAAIAIDKERERDIQEISERYDAGGHTASVQELEYISHRFNFEDLRVGSLLGL